MNTIHDKQLREMIEKLAEQYIKEPNDLTTNKYKIFDSKIDLRTALQTFHKKDEMYKICINCGKETTKAHNRYMAVQCYTINEQTIDYVKNIDPSYIRNNSDDITNESDENIIHDTHHNYIILVFGLCYDCNELFDNGIETIYQYIHFKKDDVLVKIDFVFIEND